MEKSTLRLTHTRFGGFDDADTGTLFSAGDPVVAQSRVRGSQPPPAIGEPLQLGHSEIEPRGEL